MKTILLLASILAVTALAATNGGEYRTYSNLTVWVERENEIGIIDTFIVKDIVSKSFTQGRTTLRTSTGLQIDVSQPKLRIVQEVGE